MKLPIAIGALATLGGAIAAPAAAECGCYSAHRTHHVHYVHRTYYAPPIVRERVVTRVVVVGCVR